MDHSIVLAVDIGTTSVKTLAVDEEGAVHASLAVEYPLYAPLSQWAEQDADEIFAAVGRSVRGVIDKAGLRPDQIRCLSFSSAMHSLMALSENGQPLTRLITWADQRAAAQAERLNRDGSGQEVYLRTGTPIHAMSPLVKLIWARETQPAIFRAASRWVGIKEYVLFRLFGRYVMDYSLATATGLFNLSSLQWDEGALALAGIREEQLPTAVPTTFQLTGFDRGYAQEWGLSPDTPAVVGASDGTLANLGLGAIGKGQMAVTIGTSSAVRAGFDRPVLDPQGRLFCYALTERLWMVGGGSNTGGIAAQWTRDRLFPGRPLYEVLPLAGSVPAGADGLLFLPLLAGERAPFWHAEAKGVLFGLSLHHTERHILRAMMEGVLFQIRIISDLVAGLAGMPTEILASGGFARSPLWCGMLADMLGVDVHVPQAVESSALGAAALGFYAMAEERRELLGRPIHGATIYRPDEKNHRMYSELLAIYLGIYERTSDHMNELSRFQSRSRL